MGLPYLKLSIKNNTHELACMDYPAIWINVKEDTDTVYSFNKEQIQRMQDKHTDRNVVEQLEYLSFLLSYYPNKKPTDDASFILLIRNWLAMPKSATEEDINRNCMRVESENYYPFKEWKELLTLL